MTTEKSRGRKHRFLPLMIVLGAVLVMIALIASRREPEKLTRPASGALVETMTAQMQSQASEVRGHGTVRPFRQIQLSPQIAGKIEWVSPRFVSGGSFDKDEVMARIEAIDYRLNVDQARAAVAQADYQHSLAKAQAELAVQEWERLSGENGNPGEPPSELVLHGPQLKQAEANLASAQARLERAELDLERTALRAPFDCRIRSKHIDPGQFVNPGQVMATLYSTDLVEIDIRLPMAELAWIMIPGSQATVQLTTGRGTRQWSGVVDRSVGVIDSVGRLAQVVVRVEHPFDLENGNPFELSIGAFVDVIIVGKTIANVVTIPRSALHSGNVVWIAKPDSTLEIREVTIARYGDANVHVKSGIRPGEQIVLTTLAGAAGGMRLRPLERGQTG